MALDYLSQLDQVIIKQKIEVLEVLTDIEFANKYAIHNSVGQEVYYAYEDSSFFCRCFCGQDREFTVHVTDNFGQDVILVDRPWKPCGKCNCCSCIPMFRQEVTVSSEGYVLGLVHQKCSTIEENFTIKTPNGEPVLDVLGPLFTCDMCWDDSFEIKIHGQDMVIGHIRKKWSGLVKEYFTDADNFGVSFPADLDVNMKACLIGTTFLIDFMLYEKDPQKEKKKRQQGQQPTPAGFVLDAASL